MFFAYRNFTHEPDKILAQHGLGRAHHRALHFIGNNSGVTVNKLLEILGITKQSLNRVLRRLISDGLVVRKIGHIDKRKRHLHLSPNGVKLLKVLSRLQEARMRHIYRIAGMDAVSGFRRVLEAMETQ